MWKNSWDISQEYVEMRSEDPSQFNDNTNMDTSPAPAAGADAVCAAAMSAKVAEMQNELRPMQIDKDMLKKEKDIAVTAGSSYCDSAGCNVCARSVSEVDKQPRLHLVGFHTRARD